MARREVEIRILDIPARCQCGAERFIEQRLPPYRADDVFLCARCGRAQSYAELLDQIGDEAMRRARSALSSLRDAARR